MGVAGCCFLFSLFNDFNLGALQPSLGINGIALIHTESASSVRQPKCVGHSAVRPDREQCDALQVLWLLLLMLLLLLLVLLLLLLVMLLLLMLLLLWGLRVSTIRIVELTLVGSHHGRVRVGKGDIVAHRGSISGVVRVRVRHHALVTLLHLLLLLLVRVVRVLLMVSGLGREVAVSLVGGEGGA